MTEPRMLSWEPVDGPGLEEARVSVSERAVIVESVVTGEIDGFAFRATYLLHLRADWTVRGLALSVVGREPVVVARQADGSWINQVDDGPLPAIAGCEDLDLRFTPLTNTLPIRRLDLVIGAAHEMPVAYFGPPDFQPVRRVQRYTRLAERLYRYEDVASGFTAELLVDEDGFVLDYPGYYRRLSSKEGS